MVPPKYKIKMKHKKNIKKHIVNPYGAKLHLISNLQLYIFYIFIK